MMGSRRWKRKHIAVHDGALVYFDPSTEDKGSTIELDTDVSWSQDGLHLTFHNSERDYHFRFASLENLNVIVNAVECTRRSKE